MAIAEGYDLVALQMFVAAVSEVVAAFLRGRRGAIAMNDCQVKQAVVMKPAHRASKDGIHAAIGLPATKRSIDARVMNFWVTFCIPRDWQHLPLTAHVQHLQDVVEDLVQGQRGRRSATAQAQMRQDKFVELLRVQFRGNHLPAWASGHSLRPEILDFTRSDLATRKTGLRATWRQIRCRGKTSNQLTTT